MGPVRAVGSSSVTTRTLNPTLNPPQHRAAALTQAGEHRVLPGNTGRKTSDRGSEADPSAAVLTAAVNDGSGAIPPEPGLWEAAPQASRGQNLTPAKR